MVNEEAGVRWRVVFHLDDGRIRAGTYGLASASQQIAYALGTGRVVTWDLVAVQPSGKPA